MAVSIKFDEIVPEKFDPGVFRLYLLTEARRIGREIRTDMARPTETWDSKVKFDMKVGLARNTVSVTVESFDENYVRVSEGTKKREEPVVPVGPGVKALAIPMTYTSKTLPGTLDARAGGYGDDVIYRKSMDPEPIAPRKFDEQVKELWDPKFPERVQEALEIAADKSGFGV